MMIKQIVIDDKQEIFFRSDDFYGNSFGGWIKSSTFALGIREKAILPPMLLT